MDRLFPHDAGRPMSMSLATLGLASVDESLVKSLLRIFEGRTRIGWQHVSGADADVVICVPGTPQAEQARSLETRMGRPLCIALHEVNQHSDAWNRSLHRPIRMREFMDALETIAAELDTGGKTHGKPRGASEMPVAAPVPAPRQSLVEGLQKLYLDEAATACVWRVKADAHELLVCLPQGKCYSADGFAEGALADLSSPYHQISVHPATQSDADNVAGTQDWIWLDALLWRMGLIGRGQKALGGDPAQLRYHLSSWPDLGRIPSDLLHIRLTALFSRQTLAIDEAARLLGAPIDCVTDFLRACGCCGILQVSRQVTAVAVPATKTHHGFGLFDRLRSALGMRH